MKILMVSIFSKHFFNWTEQLRDSGHEVHWLDVFDSNTRVQKIDFVNQITGWRYKKDFKGRYLLKSKAPKLSKCINLLNERKLANILESKIKQIQPDVVHSFVIYLSGVPILPVMNKFPDIKWVMSTWGSDLYYYRNQKTHLAGIKTVLSKINYLFTDCKRDYHIALNNGFHGKFLGIFPGGGGYDFEILEKYTVPFETKKAILIKGYQGTHGKCLQVLKALAGLYYELQHCELLIFGADNEVFEFIDQSELKNWLNIQCLGKVRHEEVLELMGRSLVYIGNSSSDGIPNTLLEAIIMGTFPIQSDPGGATGELIKDGKNGLLIQDPDSPEHIAQTLLRALKDPELIREGVKYNDRHIKPALEREKIRDQVLKKYQIIEREIGNG